MAQRTGTCIVVGSSSGIGLAVARRLAAAGRKVAMLARRESELAAQVATTNDVVGRQLAFAFVHDAADLDAVESLDHPEQRVLHEVGRVEERARVDGQAPARPALQAREVAGEELLQRLRIALLRAHEEHARGEVRRRRPARREGGAHSPVAPNAAQ